jgi:DNA-binding response OmpR family regulator
MRVLVVEDDPALRSVLERGLGEAGYVVDTASDGEEGLAYLDAFEYEIAVLDWRLPRRTGIEVLAEMRSKGCAVPVLMLTARDAPADRVTGLDAGADDYLVKPFDLGELLARLRALARRPQEVHAGRLVVGDVSFDPRTAQVRVGPDLVALPPIEIRILELLLKRSPAVVSRSSIAMHGWHDEAGAVGSNTIDVHIARLRSKLAGASVRIETVRGAGYRLAGGRR